MRARLGVAALAAAGLWWGCASHDHAPPPPNPNPHQIQHDKDGGTDGGTDAGPDAGPPDGGPELPDAGPPDAGPPRPTGYNFPNPAGWQFFGVQNFGPVHVYGTAIDEGGNLWVAGGEEGLFLMTPAEQAKGAAAQFRVLTMQPDSTTGGAADPNAVLHPWGYMPDGTDAPGPHYLKVISVAGGPPGTVFVGYEGKPAAPGHAPCENEWDEGNPPDPSVYKSGDADRVELQADGSFKVVHYDIFSGPGMVAGEPRGREKVCTVHRLKYDGNHNSVWYGGNHGFGWLNPTYAGAQATHCFGDNYGNWHNGCSGVLEHAHPAFACYGDDGSVGTCTYGYWALDVDPNDNLWVGGWDRSLVWNMSGTVGAFWGYEEKQFQIGFPTQIDIWPDSAPEYTYANQRTDDGVLGVAAMPDGSAYFASYAHGIVHMSLGGGWSGVGGEIDPHLSAAARDPSGDAVWFGGYGGVSILHGGSWTNLSLPYFGSDLLGGKIADIQAQVVNGHREMAVGFMHRENGEGPDAVGIYSGDGVPSP